MESLVLNLESKSEIIAYRDNNCHVQYEYGIIAELLDAIDHNDLETWNWFTMFGNSLRVIPMNVSAYRKALEFGFTEIAFDEYGWFKRPVWLEKEDISLGDISRYGNYSVIYVGRGMNNIWTYAMDYNFGTAGGGYHLSVFGKQFSSRDAALTFALAELKQMMLEKVGHSDTSNYKQPIIMVTLRDIEKKQLSMVQLTLF